MSICEMYWRCICMLPPGAVVAVFNSLSNELTTTRAQYSAGGTPSGADTMIRTTCDSLGPRTNRWGKALSHKTAEGSLTYGESRYCMANFPLSPTTGYPYLNSTQASCRFSVGLVTLTETVLLGGFRKR